ncbi:MAG TPA: hypothetical protein VNQ78_06965 [Paracoccus sp. (in: a-proteobacteria)]|uniref:hypothetical protein n=1 Tax=Paracoccus sp. TaxID=267 RepID=UPI002C023F82|nr:hypothetical protein [Paracoccus sp. (in: a-proteobacteria)]HWL56406.1 hypothetical protein [Paracoccus sp. (in: a-proteobacteria)]
MTIYATNGTKIFIGAALAAKQTDFILSDFPTTGWVEVGETEGLGTVGDTSAEIAFDGINSSRTRRLKGTRNAGTMEVVCGIDYADPGQIAVIAAEKTPHDYAFKMVLNDAPAGGTPSERYFVAKVAAATEQYDTANSVLKLNVSLWVNSNIVKVDADAA